MNDLFKLEVDSEDKNEELEQKQQQESDEQQIEEIRVLMNGLKDTMGNSKQFMNLENQKLHELYDYISKTDDDETKARLLDLFNELTQAQKNVLYFYKFVDDHIEKKIHQVIRQLNATKPVVVAKTKQSDIYQDQDQEIGVSRGPYKKYTSDTKMEALNKLRLGYSIKDVCEEMEIPKKNLRRWIELGAERKKGGGRKRMDEEMEENLYEWCLEESLRKERPVSRVQIRQKALEFSKYPEKFKASKGWTDKFVKKFNLRKKIIKNLQEHGLYKQYHQRKQQQQCQQDQNQQEQEYEEQEQEQDYDNDSEIKMEVFESEFDNE